MAEVTYEIIEHDGGWAYRVGETISETYPTKELAHQAAALAAGEQRAPGDAGPIEYEDVSGDWRQEQTSGRDRPETEVKD